MKTDIFVHETAEVEPGAEIDAGTSIWHHTHVRASARVGSDCTIGAHVYIDQGVVIGDRVKVQNQASIFGPTKIGDGCFIGPGACLTNDRRPRAVTPEGTPKNTHEWDAAGIVVSEGASIGAMATIVSGVTIGSWALVGAGAVVTRDVADYTVVVGVPAKEQGYVCRCARPLDEELTCSNSHRFERAAGTLRLISQ